LVFSLAGRSCHGLSLFLKVQVDTILKATTVRKRTNPEGNDYRNV
jgi:hypothetical protein